MHCWSHSLSKDFFGGVEVDRILIGIGLQITPAQYDYKVLAIRSELCNPPIGCAARKIVRIGETGHFNHVFDTDISARLPKDHQVGHEYRDHKRNETQDSHTSPKVLQNG